MTVEKFAEVFGIEKNIAYGLLRFLAENKLCATGKLPQPEGKKGKPSTLYMLDASVGERLVALLQSKIGQLNVQPATVQPVAECVVATSEAVVVGEV